MAYQEPNKDGFYGKFGGRFVPETLMTAVLELEEAYRESQADPSFQEELNQLCASMWDVKLLFTTQKLDPAYWRSQDLP